VGLMPRSFWNIFLMLSGLPRCLWRCGAGEDEGVAVAAAGAAGDGDAALALAAGAAFLVFAGEG
jgi:hypothetical protein